MRLMGCAENARPGRRNTSGSSASLGGSRSGWWIVLAKGFCREIWGKGSWELVWRGEKRTMDWTERAVGVLWNWGTFLKEGAPVAGVHVKEKKITGRTWSWGVSDAFICFFVLFWATHYAQRLNLSLLVIYLTQGHCRNFHKPVA